MANENVAAPAMGEIRNHLTDAATLGDLLLWIENARALLLHIQHVAQVDKTFQEVIKNCAISIDSAVWDQGESDALILLNLQMLGYIHKARMAAEGGTK